MSDRLPALPELTAEASEEAVSLVLKLAPALHQAGVPAHRLEELMTQVAAKLGLEARFFTAPTAIIASFGPPHALRTGLLRIEPGDMDLGKLADLDELVERLVRGDITATGAIRALDAIVAAPARYHELVVAIAFGLAGAAGARLFGGGLHEAVVAGGISLLVGLLQAVSSHVAGFTRILEPVGGFLASFVAVVAAHLFAPLSVEVTTVAGLYMLLPGLTFTVALTEVATRNLISGTTRLMGAALVFLELAFGVALGGRVGGLLVSGVREHASPLPADWTQALALVVATVALTVLFRARRRDVLWILGAGVIAYLGARTGRVTVGPELGAFVGALLLGTASNLAARHWSRPAVVTIVPGLMMLVPGSIGFRSLEALRERDVLGGVSSAFTMAFVAVALVAGLLLSNVVAPARRAL